VLDDNYRELAIWTLSFERQWTVLFAPLLLREGALEIRPKTASGPLAVRVRHVGDDAGDTIQNPLLR
jgi:hypothetical protein